MLAPSAASAALNSAWTLHGVLLVLALAVIVLSGWLRVSGDRVVLPPADVTLPGLCVYRSVLGLDCPGCGLTRSFISLAHGNLSAAWRYNPAGLVLFMVVLFQVPYRTVQIWRLRRGFDELSLRVGHWLPWLLATLLLGQWLVRTLLRSIT